MKLRPERKFEFPVKGKGAFRVLIVVVVALGLIGFTLSYLEKSVAIEADDKIYEYNTFKHTVDEALHEKGIILQAKDTVTPGLQTKLQDGLAIKVVRAIDVVVLVDGKSIKVKTPPRKLSQILTDAKVTLYPEDKVSMPLSQIPEPGSEIKVVRVVEKLVSSTRNLAYKTEIRTDNTLEKGIRRIVRRGKTGLEETTSKITYEDGKIAKSEIVSNKVVTEPQNEMVAYGSITTVSRGGHVINFKEAMVSVTTAYTHTGRNTYSGTKPVVGVVAVDPKVIKLGTRLYVEGYGYARAMDIGSSIKGNRVDVFFDTEKECRRWGRRTVKVYIVK